MRVKVQRCGAIQGQDPGAERAFTLFKPMLRTLAGASAWTRVLLPDGRVITISGDDLQRSFSDNWLPYLAFERKIAWRDLGVSKDGETFLAAAVLPMEFSSSAHTPEACPVGAASRSSTAPSHGGGQGQGVAQHGRGGASLVSVLG